MSPFVVWDTEVVTESSESFLRALDVLLGFVLRRRQQWRRM